MLAHAPCSLAFVNDSSWATTTIAVVFFASLVAVGLAIRPLQLSEKGREARDYLELIELYEKLLPWAVVWGIEDQWMHGGFSGRGSRGGGGGGR